MALSQSKLSTELQAMVPVDNEPDAINNFATAFENYFLESTCGGKTVENDSLAACTTALKTACVGMSTTGAVSMAAGISAFWGIVATTGAIIWILAPPITVVAPPTGLGGLAAAIAATGATNMASSKNLIDSADAMATTIHALMLGGIATTLPGPPPVTIPIL